MSFLLRVTLIVCAVIVLAFVVRKIKKSQFTAGDSIFWLALSVGLVLVAVFPGIAFFFSNALGIQSPSNFVFLAIIALLIIHQFTIQAELSTLRAKFTALVQEVTLRDMDQRER